MNPIFLDLEKVLRVQRSLIEQYGGLEGVRDPGLLHAAVAMPQASFGGEYLHKDLFAMAAGYLYHIVQNHPFLDGNKRTGAAAAIIFLAMNDIELKADQEGLVEITLAVAKGKARKRQVANFFRKLAE